MALLTSGVALGVHVPALLLRRRLQERGIASRVDVFERLLTADRRARIPAAKRAFHRDLRLAVAGHRLTRDLSDAVDPRELDALRREWERARVTRFVVFSGFWLPLLDARDAVEICHVDSVRSPSFTAVGPSGHREVWLLDAAKREIPRTIPVTATTPIPWPDRAIRVLVHGGGWGMGTYRDRAADLVRHGIAVDLVVHETPVTPAPGTRHFLLDPEWQPWHDDGFPPFGEVRADGSVRYGRAEEHHDSFFLVRESLAVVSKPGGGTLLDSLSAATPVVLLEPVAEHEAANARLWCELGFGISYDEWIAAGCSTAVLERLHHNLSRTQVPSYAEELAR